MDLVAACRVFVHVGERGSFTLGAAAARVPQPVASRRVAALERHFGAPLFDRSTRRATLTVFGRDMLPSAKRLVAQADAIEDDAARAKLRPLTVAVPDVCSVRRLAALDAAARASGTSVDLRVAGPEERAGLLRTREVRAALLAVPPTDADWTVPLGVAAASAGKTHPLHSTLRPGRAQAGDVRPLHLSTLRPGRAQAGCYRRIWLQPEDDVPHVRDHLERAGHRAALVPAQVTVAASLIAAVSAVAGGDDLLLCSPAQAEELDLSWRPLAGAPVARGYRVSAATSDDADRLRTDLGPYVAHAVGASAELEAGDLPRAEGPADVRAQTVSGNP